MVGGVAWRFSHLTDAMGALQEARWSYRWKQRNIAEKNQAEALFCCCACFVLISFFSSNTDEYAIPVIEALVWLIEMINIVPTVGTSCLWSIIANASLIVAPMMLDTDLVSKRPGFWLLWQHVEKPFSCWPVGGYTASAQHRIYDDIWSPWKGKHLHTTMSLVLMLLV